MLLILFLGLLSSQVLAGDEVPRVLIPELGALEGRVSKSYAGADYVSFTGIPYAKPPIGALRFEDPVPMEPWSGTWVANFSLYCIQVNHHIDPAGGVDMGHEDCLYLNVYVPGGKIDPNKNLDVVVHIHGGGFMFGSANYNGPKFLMDRNIVLITFNYRLGVLGFLSTGDRYLPGNLGMKDQTMVLKWVNKHIHHFGGNPKSITITGLSAGGASVQYHYLSPLSRGLFHRGISHSGCVLNSWTMQEEPLEKTRVIGKAVGCTQESTKELVACLKQRPAERLSRAIRDLRPWIFNPFSPLGLVVEKDNTDAFLPEHPYKMLMDGNVFDAPWIISVTTSEGLYPLAEFYNRDDILSELNDKWETLAPMVLHYMETIPDKSKSEVASKMKKYYLGDNDLDRNSFDKFVQMASDRLFVYDIDTCARIQSKAVKSPIYFYVYDYAATSRVSLVSLFTPITGSIGVCHGDDFMLILSQVSEGIPKKMNQQDEQVKDVLLDIYSTFAKTGEPKIKDWVPVSKNVNDPIMYLNFGKDGNHEMEAVEELGHKKFWHSLKFEENENLFKTYDRSEL